MKKIKPALLLLLVSVTLLTGFSTSKGKKAGQIAFNLEKDKALFDTIVYMDSILFNAFNTCKIEKFKTLFTPELEFYHDKGGLTNYAQTIQSMESTCGRVSKVRRELVPGSTEVYPVKDYGAIQTGTHRFYNTEKGPEELGGTFKFLHVWQKKNGVWQISRVVSYDH